MPGHASGRTFYSIPPRSENEWITIIQDARALLVTFDADFMQYCGPATRGPAIYFFSEFSDPNNFGAVLSEPSPADPHIDILIDLAKNNHEADFRDLALAVGVEADKLNELWEGTRKRTHNINRRKRNGRR